jgi:hypothetical protein
VGGDEAPEGSLGDAVVDRDVVSERQHYPHYGDVYISGRYNIYS